ncbi:MAG: hypothetical protein ACREAR_05440 [Nitrosotalea sp.]
MKTIHLLIITLSCITAIGTISFVLIDIQSKNNENNMYVFEGNYGIANNLTTIYDKSFFVSQSYPQDYVNDAIQFHGVIFSMSNYTGFTDPGGFIGNMVRFTDNTNETLTTGHGEHPTNTITMLTRHENPQAGVTRYSNGSVNFLVNTPILTVEGLKDSYHTGEQINIIIDYQGQTQYCEHPHVEVLDSNQSVIWKSIEGITLCVSSPFSPPPYVNQKFDLNSGYGGPVVINNVGRYTLKISLYGNNIEKGFTVE